MENVHQHGQSRSAQEEADNYRHEGRKRLKLSNSEAPPNPFKPSTQLEEDNQSTDAQLEGKIIGSIRTIPFQTTNDWFQCMNVWFRNSQFLNKLRRKNREDEETNPPKLQEPPEPPQLVLPTPQSALPQLQQVQPRPANGQFLSQLATTNNQDAQLPGGIQDQHHEQQALGQHLDPLQPNWQRQQIIANTQFLEGLRLAREQQARQEWAQLAQQQVAAENAQFLRRLEPPPGPQPQEIVTKSPRISLNQTAQWDWGRRDVYNDAAGNVHYLSQCRQHPASTSSNDLNTKRFSGLTGESSTSTTAQASSISNHFLGQANADEISFQYESLPNESTNCIRLLSLDLSSIGQENKDDLYCTLIVRNPWEDPIDYHCLSYCWGGERKTHRVYVSTPDNESSYRPISITKNLHRALKQIIQSQGVRRLWVDALCINQNDLIERSSQVAMMKQIYSQAAGVTIWLGEGETEPSTRACTNFIEALCTRFTKATSVPPSTITGPQGLTLNLEQLDELRLDAHREPLAYHYFAQLSRFFSLPWFRRVWVLQEAFSNTTVTAWFGSNHLHWGQIILAALWHSFLIRDYISKADAEKRDDNEMNTGYLPELWLGLLHNRVPRGLSMIELVCRARDFQATDPRDKVFALLGLANDSPTLLPDYTKPKTQVYTDFAKSIISQTGNLDILSAVDTFTRRLVPRSTPSWMPDLDVSIATIRGLGFPRKYNASFSTTAKVNTPDSPSSILSVTGFEIDVVTPTISPLLSLTKDLKLYIGDSPTAIPSLWQSFIRCQPQFSAQDPVVTLKAFVRTLTATGFALPTSFPAHPLGRVVPPDQAPTLYRDFLAYYTRTDPELSILKEVPGFEDEESIKTLAEEGDADQFAVLAGKACDERFFFVSGAGRLGLCPREAKEGDKIVVLYGGSVPYVLRPLHGGRWMFVGECYVDGIMFGQAEALKAQRGICDRVFDIR